MLVAYNNGSIASSKRNKITLEFNAIIGTNLIVKSAMLNIQILLRKIKPHLN